VAAFIAAQRDGHRIPHGVSCRALGVSQSWFYKWRSHARAGTLPPRAHLAAEVKRLFAEHEGKRGSPMITADLKDAGWRVSQNTVAKLMAEQNLAARPRRRRKSTTRPGRGRWRAPDLVKRQFPTARLNHKWYGDGTEIPTDEGKLHLVSVMDAASRRIVGFTLSERRDAAAAYGALAMAITVRGGQVPGVIMHTGRGSEYTARAFQAACQRVGIAQSMGRPGSALDNAVIESGKYSRSACRSRWVVRVRSQISVLWVRATTLTAWAWALSPATGRSWWASVRTMSASTCASAASLLAPDTACRLRYCAACNGLTANTSYPAAASAATHGPRSVSIPTSTCTSSGSASASCPAIMACSRAMPATPSGSRALASTRPAASISSTS
jgi:putative transposase